MLKEQGSEARGRELKSRRERELEELRSRGVAKTRRDKLKFYSGSLQTALESKRFLLECHNVHKKESGVKPKYNPSTVSAVDYNSFLMNQSKRQREQKMRRREAEQLLHGFRGFYGESFISWSPRHAKNQRNSDGGYFGFGEEDALRDPDDESTRRDTMLSQDWGDESRDDSTPRRYSQRFKPNPLDPRCAEFLNNDRHYDGTKYTRTEQDMEVQSGVVMFSPRADGQSDNQFPPRPPSTTRSSATRRKQSFGEASTSTDLPVEFEENEFREGPPSTTRSSTSDQKAFFKSPGSTTSENYGRRHNGFCASPYEAPRMKIYTPGSASSKDFERDQPEELDELIGQITEQRSAEGEVHEPATSSSYDEAPRMKMYIPTGSSSEDVERSPSGLHANNSNRFERNIDESEESVSPQDARRRSHDPSGASSVDLNREDSFEGSTQNEARRLSEDPSGREPATSRERRLQLQINTERQEEIDTTPSAERLREANEEARSWRNERREILPAPSEDSTVLSPSRRSNRNKPKVVEEPVPEVKKSPVPETIWRDFISDEPGAKFPPEAGRYHLYASYACPGSHRALIVRALKGLEDVISVTIVHPTWRHTNPDNSKDKHRGWIFGDPYGKPFHNTMGRGGPFPPAYPGNDPDPVLNAFSVRNLYEYAKDTSGKYTIPLLWDKKLNTIVNNESSDISYMLNSCFNKFAEKPELDLYTEDDDEGLDRLNEVSQWLYPMMIHGVYRCGFAKTQRAYDIAIEELTAAFDAADQLLQQQRYLTGDTLTDADIRFFVTLLRFDEVYAFYFRANTRLVLMTPSLLNFCREIYQMPGVAETCQMDQIKAHFFGSHAEWNKYSVVPRGLDFMRYLEMPHDRERVSSFGHI